MLKHLYYKLTSRIPRLLPRTSEEYQKFKDVLVKHYGVTDSDESWAVIASQVQANPSVNGVPTNTLRRDYASIANAVMRRQVNEVAQIEKVKHFAVISQKLKEAAERENARTRANGQSIPELSEGTSNPSGEMLGMPEPEISLV